MEYFRAIFFLVLGLSLAIARSPPRIPPGLENLDTFPQRPTAKDTCDDGNGQTRTLDEEWVEGDIWCECIYPESLLWFWDGRNPSDARNNCKLNGCRSPASSDLLHDGDVFTNEKGDRCLCRQKSNPSLADAFTRFHAKCVYGPGKYDYYTVDWDREFQ